MLGIISARRHHAAVARYEAALTKAVQRLHESYSDHLNDLAHAETDRLKLSDRLQRALRGCARYRDQTAAQDGLVRYLCDCLLDPRYMVPGPTRGPGAPPGPPSPGETGTGQP